MVVVAIPGEEEGSRVGAQGDLHAQFPRKEGFGFLEAFHVEVQVAKVGFGVEGAGAWSLGKKPFQVQGSGEHQGSFGPLPLGPVPVELEAIPLRIAEVQGLGYAVVRRALKVDRGA